MKKVTVIKFLLALRPKWTPLRSAVNCQAPVMAKFGPIQGPGWHCIDVLDGAEASHARAAAAEVEIVTESLA